MENRNLEKALDIVSVLITGQTVSEQGEYAALYQEYNNNTEVFDMVQMTLQKMNLSLYAYNNSLFVSAGENNTVFGYSNEELRKVLGVKVNRDLYLAYFVMYHVMMEFYKDTVSSTYAEFVRSEEIIRAVDESAAAILKGREGFVTDEIVANSFTELALRWEELPVMTVEENSEVRAAKNSKSGFVKMVFNFMVSQELLMVSDDRYYPTDRFRAMVEHYFDDYKGRFTEQMQQMMRGEEDAAD